MTGYIGGGRREGVGGGSQRRTKRRRRYEGQGKVKGRNESGDGGQMRDDAGPLKRKTHSKA